MELEKYSREIFKALNSDETLLRLLHYKPISKLDNPLDPTKPNILEKQADEKWTIIDDCIVNAPKISDLEATSKSRLFYYAGYGRGSNNNYLFSNQEFCFEVFTHYDFQMMDRRNEKICDRLNEILFGKNLAGLGKFLFRERHPVKAPKDYLGYKLVYEFTSENY